ncbi:hypothetical protein OSB04_un000997 [Centaurea solstitialis]|uniref:Uncharacterized protein n=1 Tax=Centaurea solstitialis TaxID=347529 RepID=A0AA38S566_9ASTR|nr:hypothetical protein OSB04_un000997 [Centaurea solstitialis]
MNSLIANGVWVDVTDDESIDFYTVVTLSLYRYYLFFSPFKQIEMIEVFLFGIVLGLIPITLAGLFVTAYLQYSAAISWTFD